MRTRTYHEEHEEHEEGISYHEEHEEQEECRSVSCPAGGLGRLKSEVASRRAVDHGRDTVYAAPLGQDSVALWPTPRLPPALLARREARLKPARPACRGLGVHQFKLVADSRSAEADQKAPTSSATSLTLLPHPATLTLCSRPKGGASVHAGRVCSVAGDE